MCTVPAQLANDLTAAAQGDVISLAGINPINCPETSMAETWSGGRLVFSDSPESPTQRGKLYEDAALPATSGDAYHRVFLYHVNNKPSGKMKFAVLIKNTSGVAATLQVQKSGTAGPSTSYGYAGKLAFQRWLLSTAGAAVSVPAGATVRLDAAFDALQGNPGNLLHGIWDYSMTQAHAVLVVALDANDNPLTVGPTLALLARDTHQRGTFPNCDKVYDTASGVVVDTAADIQQFPLGAGSANDAAAVGVDATDGSAQTLAGNYGVLYRMHLATASSDGRNLGYLINPRGGAWGGAQWALNGVTPGGKILVPTGTGLTSDSTKGTVCGKWSPGAGLTVWCQFMPTGGSAFPLRFVAVPY